MEIHRNIITKGTDFFNFCKNLEIDTDIQKLIAMRLKNITKRINLDYWDSDSESQHCLVVGSYGRRTAIQTSDIDVVVELPWGEYTRFNNYSANKQSALLQDVRDSLKKTYPKSKISGDGQVVDIDFSDGIKFEVVPAFKLSDGRYIYADTNDGGSWETMSPSYEMFLFSTADSRFNGNLVRLCRMVRSWKQTMFLPLSKTLPGIIIDSMAYRFLNQYEHANKSYDSYDCMTRDFFKYIIDNIGANRWCRIDFSERLSLLYPNLVKSRAQKAYQLSCDAICAYSNRYYYLWHQKWRDIYGTKFPNA